MCKTEMLRIKRKAECLGLSHLWVKRLFTTTFYIVYFVLGILFVYNIHVGDSTGNSFAVQEYTKQNTES